MIKKVLSFIVLGLMLSFSAFAAHYPEPLEAMPETPPPVGEYSQVINRPYYDGYRLDYCWRNGTLCGKTAADKYCQSRGFYHAANFERDHSVGTPTKVMSTAHICQHCAGFKFIHCVGEKKLAHPIYIENEYRNHALMYNPTINGEKVNWCKGFINHCAWRTADKYCVMHGFKKAANIRRFWDAGMTEDIRNKPCKGPRCDAYRWISCDRYHRV